jgi:uncharacterized membrane protein
MRKSFLLSNPFLMLAFLLATFTFSSCSRNTSSVSQWTKLENKQAIAKQQAATPVETAVNTEAPAQEVATQQPATQDVITKTATAKVNALSRIVERQITHKLQKSGKVITAFKAPKDSPTMATQIDGKLRMAIMLALIGLILVIIGGVIPVIGVVFYIIGTILILVGLIYLVMWIMSM